MRKGRDGGKKNMKKKEEKKREKTDENSGYYVIASSRPPECWPLERRTLAPKTQHFQDAFWNLILSNSGKVLELPRSGSFLLWPQNLHLVAIWYQKLKCGWTDSIAQNCFNMPGIPKCSCIHCLLLFPKCSSQVVKYCVILLEMWSYLQFLFLLSPVTTITTSYFIIHTNFWWITSCRWGEGKLINSFKHFWGENNLWCNSTH